MEAHLDRGSRQAVINTYLGAVRDFGALSVDGVAVRDALRAGTTNLWNASSVRESSLWTDPQFFPRLSLLRGDVTAHSPKLTKNYLRKVRVIGAWCRAFVHALHRRNLTSHCDVMFVEYLPATYRAQTNGGSQYFGALSTVINEQGTSVGFLHIHSDGPVTRPTRQARHTLNELNTTEVPHLVLADFLTLRVWWKALRAWWRLQNQVPRSREIEQALVPHSDLARVWPTWQEMYDDSVRGTHSVRTCLLTAMFDRAVGQHANTTMWLSAFEGQSWEACLTASLRKNNAQWIPYLHTMMRPWDLRAHTFLQELPPALLAIHGKHDRTELQSRGVTMIDVEALRYQQLATRPVRSMATEQSTTALQPWLVVGGAECVRSNEELRIFLAAVQQSGVTRSVIVKWHPQCGEPTAVLPAWVSLSTDSLAALTQHVGAALMVGSAAPLDTYLAGVPSCALQTLSGYAMSPIEENSYFHTATNGKDAVEWMTQAEHRAGFKAPVDDYFILDAALPRWRQLLAEKLVR